MSRFRSIYVTVPWALGSAELDCEATVRIDPPEPMVMYDSNGEGCPGCPAEAEIVEARIIENGKRRRLTDEEWERLEEDGGEVLEAAFDEADAEAAAC